MPSIRLSPLALRAPVSRSIGASRSFCASVPRAIGKESELSTSNFPIPFWRDCKQDARSELDANLVFTTDSRTPEQAEQLKQQQLKEQKEGKGKWHEGLASDSESAVSLDSSQSGVSLL